MKLLTLNCHSWQEEQQLEKIKILAEAIKENRYDVIALQEVSQHIKAHLIDGHIKKDNYALLLIEELRKIGVEDYVFKWDFSHIGYDIYEEGLAILTKHEIKEDFSFFITQNKDQALWKTRKIIGVKIVYKNRPITFYSCHLGWWDDEEESFKFQAESLLAHASKDEPAIFMGDFNSSAYVRNEGYDFLIDKGLYDTFELADKKDSGVTVKGKIAGWDENKHEMRIDLILSSYPIHPKYSRVIFNGTNKPIISDHYGVEIEI
ncbi:endonuclease/exonuclease/phosphatase family protein [Cytobacillus firmus]|uniref:endonuclease/exonuclease/phosphatase family protein n=1 Tax=Cytobacillus firmus TaxID=1399 RepID=UPI00077CA078|nr:endonuclease/exonuclease/phosphatase family protein [Cytobacillus firmus]MBG9544781.1 endonuclease [Cytobacillus firmus]MBG9546082.1 endonuclease [Cytobacillus firmus]MBG9551884.1 endonuclease [Cytobacillus firmus]MBG9559143.1 endonuclease [Cytobacillus firmus]MBG9577384.1 endonuclease [Cytobacillus firmus]